jgi:hypothetical protein
MEAANASTYDILITGINYAAKCCGNYKTFAVKESEL